MSRSWIAAALVAVLGGGTLVLGQARPAQAAGAPAALVSCTICHDVSAARKAKVGPPLFGVFGRKPSIAGVSFGKWDDGALDKWLADPKAVKPGTTMTFNVADGSARKAAIAALKNLR